MACQQAINHSTQRLNHQYGNVNVTDCATALIGDLHVHNSTSNTKLDPERRYFALKALYYGSMNSRKNQIVSAQSDTCNWIWKTAFRNWLGHSKTTVFWISGKPGSGKSTLMKFLASSAEVKKRLPVLEYRKWMTLDFFFDFRFANDIGNSVEGLLRSILHQLIGSLRETSSLVEADPSIAVGASMDKLLELCKSLLQSENLAFLILVDGLDEFTGNMRYLLKFLLALCNTGCVKLCLASRPEPMVREMLAMAPSLNLSDHNSEGIRCYLDDAIKEFQPHLDALKLRDLEDVMLKRADGVFLWVYLVVEEVLQACVTGATETEIRAQLDCLAVEVQELYQRIVNRISSERRAEAAILYTLISTADFRMSLQLLQGAVYLLRAQSLACFLPDIEDTDRFSSRLLATMGGLLEVTRETDQNRVTHTYVRLIHETVSSFTLQSQWCRDWLPSSFSSVFPDNVWTRLYSEVLFATSDKDFSSDNFPPFRFDDFIFNQESQRAFVDMFGARGNLCKRVVFLLHRAVTQIPDLCSKALERPMGDLLRDRLIITLCCQASSMHSALVPSHYCPWPLALDMHDLIMAASHRQYQYLQLNEQRIAHDLYDYQRDDIAAVLLWTSHNSNKTLSLCKNSFRTAESLSIHDIVDMVLRHNRRYTAFHVALYLLFGYQTVPEYFERLKQQHLSLRDSTWTLVPAPYWLGAESIARTVLLGIWVFADTKGCHQQGFDPETHLQDLMSLGLDIHAPHPKNGENIIHYLLERYIHQTWRLLPRSKEFLAKLHILKRHGVDFHARNKIGNTPLETFENLTRYQSSLPIRIKKHHWRVKKTLVSDGLVELFVQSEKESGVCDVQSEVGHSDRNSVRNQ